MVRERGVGVAQASRDIERPRERSSQMGEGISGADPKQAFPGHGQMKLEQLEIRPKLRVREASRKAQGGARHPKKRPQPTLRGSRHEVRLHCVKHRSVWPVAWLCRSTWRLGGLASMPG